MLKINFLNDRRFLTDQEHTEEEYRRLSPEDAESVRAHYQYGRDCQYFDAHIEELGVQYPDEYVAVYHGEVIDHDSDFAVLIRNIWSEHGED